MIVGIDLGTSTSEIAYINEQGQPEPIPNHLGSVITPSAVHINEKHEPVVGLEAREKLLVDPENTFIEVKRLMGQGKTLKARGNEYTPVQISSFILRYLVDCAEAHLSQNIDRAVITVPAYFTDKQRRETIQAGETAGLKVERIINEPTAAALDYGVTHLKDCKNILVYDFGGGTLDVTVLELFEGVADVKSSCGNNTLGGKDFDEALISDFLKRIENESNTPVSKNHRVMSRLKDAAEMCKIALSTHDEYDIDLPFLYAKQNNLPGGFSHKVSKDDFEGLIRGKVESTTAQINTALSDAGLSSDDIDLVLLVGGSTKVPLVADFLSDSLNFDPMRLIDPDMAVVRGAAIQGAIIDGALKDDNVIVLTDVCPYSLSTDVLKSFDPFMGPVLECDILIGRNTTIPVTVGKIYHTVHDYQTSVEVKVYQGESEIPNENIFLNKFLLSGLPKARAGKEKVKIEFSYNLNGILDVSAESLSNRKKAGISINTVEISEDIDEPDIELADPADWTNSEHASRYRTIIKRAEKLVASASDDDDELLEELELMLHELKFELALGLSDKDDLDDIRDDLLEAIKAYGRS